MQVTIVSALRRIAGIEAAREDDKIEKEVQELRRKFIREMKKEPLLERIGPEKLWDDLQEYIQEKVKGRRGKAADDTAEQRLQEIKREFIDGVKKSMPLWNPEELWSRIQQEIKADMRQHPDEWWAD